MVLMDFRGSSVVVITIYHLFMILLAIGTFQTLQKNNLLVFPSAPPSVSIVFIYLDLGQGLSFCRVLVPGLAQWDPSL